MNKCLAVLLARLFLLTASREKCLYKKICAFRIKKNPCISMQKMRLIIISIATILSTDQSLDVISIWASEFLTSFYTTVKQFVYKTVFSMSSSPHPIQLRKNRNKQKFIPKSSQNSLRNKSFSCSDMQVYQQ